MAGKRLLDVAALFNASRSIAHKHVALRNRQLDVYIRTSTLARAVKNQTDRFTETAKAASFLASRLNESAPAWTSEAGSESREQASSPEHGSPVPVTESMEGRKTTKPSPGGGSDQEHFYEKSETNTSTDPVPTENLDIQQEKAGRYSLPDGTIPPLGSKINSPETDQDTVSDRAPESAKEPVDSAGKKGNGLQPISCGSSTIPIPGEDVKAISSNQARISQRLSEEQIPSRTADSEGLSGSKLVQGHDEESVHIPSVHSSPSLSSLPRVKIPKQTQNLQGNDVHLQSEGINADTFSSPVQPEASITIPTVYAVPAQENIPEGVNTDLFYSPRVAKLLGGKTHGAKRPNLELKAAQGTPVEHTPLSKGKDQDTVNVRSSSQTEPETPSPAATSEASIQSKIEDGDLAKLAQDIGNEARSNLASRGFNSTGDEQRLYEMRESKVPSSRIGRLWNYGGLAAGMFGGAITESLRRATGSGGEGSYMLSAGNMDRLVAKLSRMRGAALKLGQMMSFQDSKMLPVSIQQVLQRVQDSADYMPPSQRNKVLATNLGEGWRGLFDRFDEKPIAAASIGQVHSATLKSTGQRVAVKIQYPGVSDSIDSDLSNLAVLLTASRLLPKGLFLDKTIANARTELGWECDYIREAECGRRFQTLLSDEQDVFVVPKVFPEASGKQVLTMEFLNGVGVTKVQNFTQEQKDWIGTQILRLCLREITEFRFMQTDPNWTNFLFNADTNKLELLDFGASREYPEEFISQYTQLLLAASKSDKNTVRNLSIELGYLTGHESKAMLNAHTASVLTLAEPFLASSPETYDFRDQTITERVKALIPVMVKERLAPPPEETYSLHRKLSGAFLLCARLGSRVRCRELFQNSMAKAGFI